MMESVDPERTGPFTVRKAPLSWLLGGLLLGLVQVLAVALKKPLGVSTQFAILDSMALHALAPGYASNHPLISAEKYQQLGYGFWLDVGLIIGAVIAALATRRWAIRTNTVWWELNQGPSTAKRFAAGFIGGMLILLGARLAHGCTSGQFASGWAQLSVSVIPFTIGMFVVGMIVARFTHPKTPEID